MDSAGNVYIADNYHSVIEEWNATTQRVSTLVSSGVSQPYGVAVDGSGNVYITDDQAIEEWNAATQTVTTLDTLSADFVYGVAVDSLGNVYIAGSSSGTIDERPRAFVPGGAVKEGVAAGKDELLPVLPTAESLTAPLPPPATRAG